MNEKMREMFGYPSMPDGSGYIKSRDLLISDIQSAGIEAIVNGIQLLSIDPGDLVAQGMGSRRILLDMVEAPGGKYRFFSIIRFVDEESKQMFVMKAGWYDGDMVAGGVAFNGRLN